MVKISTSHLFFSVYYWCVTKTSFLLKKFLKPLWSRMCICWQRFLISITPNQPNVYTHISRLLKSIFFIIIIIVVSKIIILSLFYIVHTSTLLFYNGLKLLYNWWKLFSFSGRKTNKSTSIQSTWIKRGGGGNYKRDKRYKIQDKQQKLIWNFFNWNRKIIFLIWLVNFFFP